MKKLFHLSLLPFVLFILCTGSSSAQSTGNQHSFFVSFEKRYFESNQVYDRAGPAFFFNARSKGFRFCLGYTLEFKKSNQLIFQAGFGKTDYGFGIAIKPYQYPEIRDVRMGSDYIPAVGNGSLGVAYSRKILNRNRFSFALTGGFDLFIQEGSVLMLYRWARNANYFGTLPPATPDTIYGEYRLTSLYDKRINFTPAITAKADLGYLFTGRSRITLGIGYTHVLSDLAGGNYDLFPQTVSRSSGKWRLRGNSVNLSATYHYLLKKRKR